MSVSGSRPNSTRGIDCAIFPRVNRPSSRVTDGISAARPIHARGKLQILDPSPEPSSRWARATLIPPARLDWVLNRALLVAQVELSTCVAHALAVLFILNPRGRVENFCSANSLSYRLR